MSPEIYFWFALAIKMAMAATFVVTATVAAERSGPAIGALIATLPVSAGPAYVFLALDHNPQFVSESALSSLWLNIATGGYSVAYILLAQRHRGMIAVPLAGAIWLSATLIYISYPWTTAWAILLNLILYPIAFFAVRAYRDVLPPPTRLEWHDIVLRAGLVAFLVASVVVLSFHVGPRMTGVIAAFPVVYTSIMLILHRRIGGRAAAAVLANGMLGLFGFGVAMATVHLLVVPLGSAAGLAVALAVAVAWNLSLYGLHRRGLIA